MSAVFGVWHRHGEPVASDVLVVMQGALAHRGPDGAGIWCQGPIGLGQQLLRVTPESMHEQLPYVDTAAELAIVADGRLDNREALLQALAIPAPAWPTVPDGHVLLHAYRQWDTACVERLLGDFVFVIWDGLRQRLFCASDHMGMCRLYYYHDDQRFVFASEIKGLLAHPGILRRLNQQKLARLAVPASLLFDKGTSFFDRIQCFPAATTLTVTATGYHWHRYWEPNLHARLHLSAAEGWEAFRELWCQAVAARVRSPYPVAALLSGGLDSSAVVAAAARVLQPQNRRLITLSAVLPPETDAGVRDEKEYIDAFQGWPNVDLIYITDPQRGPFDDLERLIWNIESPLATSRHYLYQAFFAAAATRGVRCLLEGVGGELGPSFHGAGLYAEWLLTGRWARLGRELHWRSACEGVTRWSLAKGEVLKPLLPGWCLRWLGQAERLDIVQSHLHHPLHAAFVNRVLGQEGLHALRAQAACVGRPAPWHRLNQWQRIVWAQGRYRDPFTATSGTVFMAYPFLDKRVLEFCLAAPGAWKMQQGYKRYLVRAGLAGVLPPRIQWRTTKEPFSPDFHQRYNRQRAQVLALLDGIGAMDPVRQVLDVEKLRSLAGHRMVGNLGNTPADFAAMHTVPAGIYLLTFLRQFPEFQT